MRYLVFELSYVINLLAFFCISEVLVGDVEETTTVELYPVWPSSCFFSLFAAAAC